MKSYDFNNSFSPGEFQDFARDIVQIKENIFLESFAEGRDMGLDGRSVANDGYTIIFQAKRLKNGDSKILTVVHEEKRKMDKLREMGKRVDRYILAVSDDLRQDTKEKVYQIMSPYIINPDDILMKSDFNNLLGQKKYREVEDKYYQLWIPSTNVLRKKMFEVANSALVHQSVIHYEMAVKKKDIFVETAAFREASLHLKKNRVIIISGEPGVGKTTLAEQLSLYYFAKYHFRAFVFVSSVTDLYAALEIEGKKVILYDDFWGSSGFDRFGSGKKAGELVTFIDYVRTNKDCLLVMTTREYIMEQGLEQNEKLRRMVEEYKLECRIKQYSDTDRLKIYYGHLKNSRLTWEQTRKLQSNYSKVIHSPNYNPRVIELFTKSITPDISPDECVEKLDKYIECPRDFWKKIFHDLSQEAKMLYVLTLVFPMPVEIEFLEKSYTELIKTQENAFERKGFSDAVIELEKTVLRTDLCKENNAGQMTVTYQNPSAKDFLLTLLKEDFEKYHSFLISCCQYYAQYVEYLKVLDESSASNLIYAEVYEKTVKAIGSDPISEKDTGFGRLFQLILMYKDGCGEKMKTELNRLFLSIMDGIVHYPELILSEDLQMLPEVIVAAYRKGICKKASWMLDVYFNSAMQNREVVSDIQIKRALPDIWKEYVENHRKQISDYLEKYYEAELCLAAVTGDSDEFTYQNFRCVDAYDKYGLQMSQELKKKLELYDTWVTVPEETDEFEEPNHERKEQSAEAIHSDFKENFLDSILPTWVEDTEQWIELRMTSPKVKKILKHVYAEGNIFWDSFLYDEESLKFLEAFIMSAGELPEETAEILRGITRYIEEKSGLDKDVFLEFVTRLEGGKENKKIWSVTEVEKACPDILFENENLLERMTDAHILVNQHHWYRLSNELLSFCVQMTVQVLSANEITDYYLSIRGQIIKQNIPDEDWLFWKTLKLLEPQCYEEYIFVPVMHDLYNRIAKDGKPWTKALIDYLDMYYELEDYELTGGGCTGDLSFAILEIDLDTDLLDTLTPDFSEDQVLLLKREGILEEKEQIITLRELEASALLEKLGIYEKLEILWKQICKCQTEVQHEA